jgi:hypothetical protein
MKRYQKLTMILETEREDLEWKEVLKSLIKHLDKELKVEMKEGYLDLVTKDDHIFQVFEDYDEVGKREGWIEEEEDIIH